MQDFQAVYAEYRKRIDALLEEAVSRNYPKTLYDPVKYVLNSGGKRIRPMMTIFSCETAGGSFDDSVHAALAIEMLHNFTLVHDDIMDNADLRRGEATVYKKWDSNVAILAGDQLIGLAYVQLLNTSDADIRKLSRAFTEGIIEVCEGQSFDKEFEIRKDVTIDEYMMMIGKKTSKMLETAAAIGAIAGRADDFVTDKVKAFALNTGLAFQILDDLLDIISDEPEFGKKIGGDVIEGKKTYLLLKAIENASGASKKVLMKIVQNNGLTDVTKENIDEVRNIYEETGAVKSARGEIHRFTDKAIGCIKHLPDNEGRQRLQWLGEMLMNRSI